jgi:predicted metal-dependent hydrolase
MAERAQKAAPPRPVKGESRRFLGRHIPLKVEKLPSTSPMRETVKLEKEHLTVWVKDVKDKERMQTLLDNWYREQAEIIFTRRMLTHLPRFQYLRQMPELKIRRMKSRWGSCGTNGVITLNLKLIQVDEALIDYVIVHELCHLIEHNHSKHYYALLSRMMPDWEERRQRLNEEELSG